MFPFCLFLAFFLIVIIKAAQSGGVFEPTEYKQTLFFTSKKQRKWLF